MESRAIDALRRATVQVSRRARQLRRVLHAEGLHGLEIRGRRAIANRLAPPVEILPISSAEVMRADLAHPPLRTSLPWAEHQPLRLNWLTTPPSPGSGGHTTLFRIINVLQSSGHENRVYLYDVYRGDHRYYADVVKHTFGFQGPVLDAEQGMSDAHAVIASAWPTAYVAFNSPCAGQRFYFVQDLEPLFHATGSLSVLAENTYRMGMHAITAGAWLATQLSQRYGMSADYFDFGCDLSCYSRPSESKRTGVAFYARPETPRRGFEIGMMALEVFAARRPEVDIHLYGESIAQGGFRFIDHGRVSAAQLAKIYSQCSAGLSISLTNVSLVPHEMLAAGCIPVVNDADHNRMVLDNPFVRYAQLTPHALAEALEQAMQDAETEGLSQQGARSVVGRSWDEAGRRVDAIFRRCLRGAFQEASPSGRRGTTLVNGVA